MVMQIIPAPYVGKGLLDDDDRNTILSQFAGGLLQGYNVNPTPVMGQYFTPIGGGTPSVTGGMQDQATQLTPEELDMMLQERANRLNLLNEGGALDDKAPDDGPLGPGGFGPLEAEPPSMTVGSIGEALSNMYSGFIDENNQYQGGFKQLGFFPGNPVNIPTAISRAVGFITGNQNLGMYDELDDLIDETGLDTSQVDIY